MIPKMYSHLKDDDENKKAQETIIKQKLKFEHYKHCLGATQSSWNTNK